jgi:hypothetical protein
LLNVNEEKQQEALKIYYKKIKPAMDKKARIENQQHFGCATYPMFCVGFVITYWVSGMLHIN